VVGIEVGGQQQVMNGIYNLGASFLYLVYAYCIDSEFTLL
jgi:hypothetical protein